MIFVKKGDEPEGLKELRDECKDMGLSPKESYRMLMNPLKKEVLDCLIREQGQLCVYCMCRIPRDDKEIGIADPTIEHFIPLE